MPTPKDRANQDPLKTTPGHHVKEPIAIIGIGCRYPGDANGPEKLWELLRNGVDAIGDIPEERWNIQTFYNPDPQAPGKTYVRQGGFLKDIDRFDAQFFGISPREAARMDPQQRLMLEVAYEAMEDAGLAPEKLDGTDTGVFVGVSTFDYAGSQSSMESRHTINAYSNLGGALSIVSNRISYLFNLKGPSMSVDTACSSALVSAHLACQSIWNGECSLVLVGGVNVTFRPELTIGFSKAAMLAPDGRCKPFDARADGYGRSEGAGMVILKPLSMALADGDSIYALIRGTAVNQDGRTAGIALPNRMAQRAVLQEAYRKAGISPKKVHYLEAHGTGTPAGDPLEASAIGWVLGKNRPAGAECLIGSIKSNIGHMEAASGMAGLIKVALCLKYKQIPPSLHFKTPSPKIPFEKLNLRVPTRLEPWPKNGPDSRFAGVNSFGFGGTNAHVVLEEAPAESPSSPNAAVEGQPLILPLSARSAEALQALAKSYCEFLTESGDGAVKSLADITYTASIRRGHHSHRLAVVAYHHKGFVENLQAFLAQETRQWMSTGQKRPGPPPKLVFVFSGIGPQWWAMGRELLKENSLVQEKIKEIDALLKRHVEWSLWKELHAEEDTTRIHETQIAQPAIFALQVALAELWKSWGVRPDAILGHSVGEVAAAHVSGALSLEDAVTLIYHRSRLQQKVSGEGQMLATGLTVEKSQQILQGYENRVSVAAINSPLSLTLAGEAAALQEIAGALEKEQIFWRFLKVEVPFHSPVMEKIKPELLESLQELHPQTAAIPLYSTALGKQIDGSEMDAGYWWQNVRNPVQFKAVIDLLIENQHTLFLEISSHPVLAASISENAAQAENTIEVFPSLRRQEPELPRLLGSLGALYCAGYDVQWKSLYPQGSQVRLPAYPWQRERYWHEVDEMIKDRTAVFHPLLGKRLKSANPAWNEIIDRRVLKYLEDHRVQESVVYPAAAYVEMALSAAKELLGDKPYQLENIQLYKMLFLPEEDALTIQLLFDASETAFDIYSKTPGALSPWMRHAAGNLFKIENGSLPASGSLEDIRQRCSKEINREEYYRQFRAIGLQYGETFQGIRQLWCGKAEALGQIHTHESLEFEMDKYQLHPAILDAAFQVLMASVSPEKYRENQAPVFLPVQIERVRLYARPGSPVWSHARMVEQSDVHLKGDIHLLDNDGNVLAEIHGIYCKPAALRRGKAENIDDYLYEYRWKLQPLSPGKERQPAEYLPTPRQIATGLKAAAEELSRRLNRKEYYENAGLKSSQLCVAYVLNAFKTLGWELALNQRVSIDFLIEKLGVAEQHRRLLGRILEILGEEGILKRAGEQWEVRKIPAALPLEEHWRSLMHHHPAYQAELLLVQRFGENFAKILRGEIEPLALIFPEGSANLAEHLYQDSPTYSIYNLLLQKTFSFMINRLPGGQSMRILEIGGGTGGSSSYVLPTLPENRTEYIFSDISQQFMAAAEQKFKNYPFVKYRVLDIESDPFAQGFEEHSFDVILASNVLHATRDLKATLENVKKLLAPRGLLILLEGTRFFHSVDLIFGSLKGWWLFEDLDLRPSHPTLSLEKWRNLLAESGFSEVAWLSDTEAEKTEQTVILAQYPDHREAAAGGEFFAPALPENPAKWLIFADRFGIAEELAKQFTALDEIPILVYPGETFQEVEKHHFQIRPDEPEDMQRLLASVSGGETECRGIIHLWSADLPPAKETTLEDLHSAEVMVTHSVMHLVQALDRMEANRPSKLWLVSRGGQLLADVLPNVDGEKFISISQAPLIGLGRVIINEQPKLATKMIDLSHEATAEEIQSLFAELWCDDAEDEIALRGKNRYVQRFMRVSREDIKRNRQQIAAESPNGKEAAADNRAFFLEIGAPGMLDSLAFRAINRRKPRPGEVEIRVFATALNFKDVVKALGLLTEASLEGTSSGKAIGLECAGKITAVGEGVEGFRVGDEVIAFAPGCFADYTIAPARFVRKKPSHLNFEEAATIPLVFITVYYSLFHLARIQKGDKILIHAAAGGVGLAAIQLARHAGAEIFATAGSAEKRDFLRALGVPHVMDSRTLAFVDEIKTLTAGGGVDIVLNSLAGEALAKSLAVLAPYGRFVELGKRDIDQNNKLGLRPFQNNLSFFSVDLDRLCAERPAVAEAVLEEVLGLFNEGKLFPLPHRTFQITDVVNAFRNMAQAKHIGKVVVSLQTPELVSPRSEETITFEKDATYLITGGLGGFGLATAEWMVENQARHLVLVGRSGADKPVAGEAVEMLQKSGAEIVVVKADISQEPDVVNLFSMIRQNMPPLRGIIHAAMVIDDAPLMQLNRDRFHKVMAPKVLGAWNLHQQSRDLPLDFFIQFSSISSLAGTPGQGNYAAANAFLDMLSHYRRNLNLPALTINWGAIGDAGYVAENPEVIKYLEKMGVKGIPARLALKMMAQLLRCQAVQNAVFSGDWHRWLKIQMPGERPRFEYLTTLASTGRGGGEGEAGDSLRNRILEAEPANRHKILEKYMCDQLAKVLGASPDKLPVDEPLLNLGVDSLMEIEMNSRIENELNVRIPTMKFMELSISGMSKAIVEQVMATETGTTKAESNA